MERLPSGSSRDMPMLRGVISKNTHGNPNIWIIICFDENKNRLVPQQMAKTVID